MIKSLEKARYSLLQQSVTIKNNQDERPTQNKELLPLIEDEEMKELMDSCSDQDSPRFRYNKPSRGKKNLINKSN
jgi:hypothetical protein